MRRRLAEFLTVFLGVALAFLADDYRERLGDRRAEEAVLSGLRTDAELNTRYLSYQIAQNKRVEIGGTELMRLLSVAGNAPELAVPDTLLMAVAVGLGPYKPIRGTVDALLNSGELRLVQDPVLRATLAEWPAALSDTNESQRRAVEVVDDHVLPALIDAGVPLARIFEYYRSWEMESLSSEAQAWATVIPNTPRVRAVVALRVRQQAIARRFLEGLGRVDARMSDLLGETS